MSLEEVLSGRRDWWMEQGDCLAVLPRVPAGSVAAVLTDPPYGMANNLNSKRFTGGDRDLRRGEGRDDWQAVKGDDQPFDPSPWLVFPKVVLWGSNHFGQRLPPGTTLVWVKKAPHLFGSFLSDAEVAWMRGGCGVYCHLEQFPPPCRMAENGGSVAHPNQKPIGLMAWCLARLTLPPGSLVFDPYAGSGTVGIACLRAGLRYLGCEISPVYHETAQRRLASFMSCGPLFGEN